MMTTDDMSFRIRHDIAFRVGDRVKIADQAVFDSGMPTLGRGKQGTIRGAHTPGSEDLMVRSDTGQYWVVHYSYLHRVEEPRLDWKALRPEPWTMTSLLGAYDAGILTGDELLAMPVGIVYPSEVCALVKRGIITIREARDYFQPPTD